MVVRSKLLTTQIEVFQPIAETRLTASGRENAKEPKRTGVNSSNSSANLCVLSVSAM